MKYKPPKRKKLERETSTVVSPALSEYRNFLNKFVVDKSPADYSQEDIDSWPDVNLETPQGKIQDEIARKFNNHHPLGIGRVNSVNTPGSLASYWGYGTDGTPEFTFPTVSPTPFTVGHELIHANDHQTDNLNAKTWNNLERLYNQSGGDSNKFKQSLNKIQNKIDPDKIFSTLYGPDFNRRKVVNDINNWRRQQTPAMEALKIQKTTHPRGSLSTEDPLEDWNPVFKAIPEVVTATDPTTRVQNLPFFLGGPSEFPAFMSERLTRPWGANTAPNPLSLPEARFLHSTLGDMEAAYPAADYPTMNRHIMARRSSLEGAYPGASIGSDDRKEDSYSPSSSSSSSSSSYPPFSSSFPSLSSSSSSGGSYGGSSSSLPYYDSGRSSSSSSPKYKITDLGGLKFKIIPSSFPGVTTAPMSSSLTSSVSPASSSRFSPLSSSSFYSPSSSSSSSSPYSSSSLQPQPTSSSLASSMLPSSSSSLLQAGPLGSAIVPLLPSLPERPDSPEYGHGGRVRRARGKKYGLSNYLNSRKHYIKTN
jgi:hypothetical protein